MSSWEVKAARKRWAVVGQDSRGINTVHRVVATTSSTSFTVPEGWKEKWLKVTPIGCNVQLAFFTGSAPTLVYNVSGSATGGSSAFPSGSYSNGATLFDGIGDEAVVPKFAQHQWVSSSFDTAPASAPLPILGCVYVCSTATSASIEFCVTEDSN